MTTADAIGLLPLRLGITRIDLRWRITAAILLELIYMLLSRIVFYWGFESFAEIEIWRTPFRLATALAQWLLVADVMFGERPAEILPDRRRLYASVGVFLITPLLTVDDTGSAPDAVILAVTSFPVALHEELFFRGVVQTLLVGRLGKVGGLGLATLLFALFHVGVTAPDFLNLLHIALGGLYFGTIYLITRSMAAAILVHTVDDTLISVPGEAPLPLVFAFILPLIALSMLWPRRSSD